MVDRLSNLIGIFQKPELSFLAERAEHDDILGDACEYARMVPFDEIAAAKNDCDLNLPRYIDSATSEDLQDIDGHSRGGIPERDLDALAPY